MPVSFAIGDDVFVRNPQNFVPDCTCIVGPVTGKRETPDGMLYLLHGSVGRMGGGADNRLWHRYSSRHRLHHERIGLQ